MRRQLSLLFSIRGAVLVCRCHVAKHVGWFCHTRVRNHHRSEKSAIIGGTKFGILSDGYAEVHALWYKIEKS